jgi:hypothetical protein
MLTPQDIHKNLMDSINEAIEEAMTQLDQLDPSLEKYLLNVVVDAAIDELNPSAPNGLVPLFRGVTVNSIRAHVAGVAASLALAAGMPATDPNPQGIVGLDLFAASDCIEANCPLQGFSVN